MPICETATGPIFYAERGVGPALVCIHGAGGSHRLWGGLFAPLSMRFRLIALDLPGHGRSPAPGCTTIADYTAVLQAFLDALRIERALLAGHSMGSAIAIQLALAAPDRVEGLFLAGPAARLRVLPAFIDGLVADTEATIELLVSLLFGPAAPPEMRSAAAADYRRCDPAVFRGDFIACNGFDVRAHLSGIRVPAIILSGEADQLTPPKLAVELQAGLANARLITLPDVGHMPLIEAPAETLAAFSGAW